MRNRFARMAAWGTTGLGLLAAAPVLAQQALERVGKPQPGGTHWQPAATELADDIHWLDGMLLVIIAAICLLVLALLAIVILRFNRRANPEPARFTHNSVLEVAWTVAPILILIVIGAFSLPILFKQLRIPDADLTIKVTGHQWYWSYEYPDHDVAFDALMLGSGKARMDDALRAELAEYGYTEDEWRLATDNAMVVPVGAVVRLQVTAADVIHSWTIPAFGVKMDAIPGRLNETWFKADRVGMYFGQCSELCGKDHAYMPIVVKVLPKADYDAWLAEAKVALGTSPAAPIRLARN
ncbi:MAG: cytochrome c oxidase subunit II [Alphaproteobacteria bacterium]|nr:MAG: cytochrome c oxidase subunit II [Alphaproteobacteria bacterium]